MMYFVISAMKGKRIKACWGFVCAFCELPFLLQASRAAKGFIYSQPTLCVSVSCRDRERERDVFIPGELSCGIIIYFYYGGKLS